MNKILKQADHRLLQRRIHCQMILRISAKCRRPGSG
jgi:hypothetical protein